MKKKQGTSLDTTEEIRDGVNNLELEVVEKPPINAGMKLLADEDFEKEKEGYESESKDDDLEQLDVALLKYDSPEKCTVSKKRKASKKLHTPKYAMFLMFQYVDTFYLIITGKAVAVLESHIL